MVLPEFSQTCHSRQGSVGTLTMQETHNVKSSSGVHGSIHQVTTFSFWTALYRIGLGEREATKNVVGNERTVTASGMSAGLSGASTNEKNREVSGRPLLGSFRFHTPSVSNRYILHE